MQWPSVVTRAGLLARSSRAWPRIACGRPSTHSRTSSVAIVPSVSPSSSSSLRRRSLDHPARLRLASSSASRARYSPRCVRRRRRRATSTAAWRYATWPCRREAGAGRNVLVEGDEPEILALGATAGGQQHPPRLDAPELRGLQVGDDDDAPPDQGFGLVELGDARDDGAPVVAEVEVELEQLVRFGDTLGGQHDGDPQVDLGEVVDGDDVALF